MTAPLLIKPDSVVVLRPIRNAGTRRALESLSHALEADHPKLAKELGEVLHQEKPQVPRTNACFDSQAFGCAVRDRRTSDGMSLRQLADALQVDASTLFRIERGSSSEINTLLTLSLWLGTELNRFVKEEHKDGT